MYSEEAKPVLGFEPSGFDEKVIFAPEIGTPRTLPSPRACDDESEFEGFDDASVFEVAGSVLFGVAGASVVLGIFGILIFGIGNCPTAGSAKNDPTAIAAIRISDDDLIINIVLSDVKCGRGSYKSLA